MTVYCKTATAEQLTLMKQFEDLTGFEFMHQEDLDSGVKTFNEAWKSNLHWYRDHVEETISAVECLYTPEEEEGEKL